MGERPRLHDVADRQGEPEVHHDEATLILYLLHDVRCFASDKSKQVQTTCLLSFFLCSLGIRSLY